MPDDLVREIDALVGPRGRSNFLVETAKAEIQRRQLLSFLGSTEPAWKDENHPKLIDGAAAWVASIRADGEQRLRHEQSTESSRK